MFYRFILVVLAIASLHSSAFASTHPDVTAYEALQSRFVLSPGQTYLSFMKNQVKPALDSYEDTIQGDSATTSKNYSLLQTDLTSKGAGVAIRIDSQNYIFNVGYLNGSNPSDDIKSGRSYGVGPTGTESDPSDLAYLTELQSYLQSEPEAAGNFVKAIMLVLTNCDSSGWSTLSTSGQSVATDFLAIYTAESDRHLMVGLNPSSHPWEIDLAAATFVSIFDVKSNLMFLNGSLVPGNITQWWAKGSQGSGVGETRKDRIALQNMIGNYEANLPETKDISVMIQSSGDNDVIQDVLEFLNTPNAPLAMSADQAEQLSELMQSYLVHVQSDATEIAGQH